MWALLCQAGSRWRLVLCVGVMSEMPVTLHLFWDEVLRVPGTSDTRQRNRWSDFFFGEGVRYRWGVTSSIVHRTQNFRIMRVACSWCPFVVCVSLVAIVIMIEKVPDELRQSLSVANAPDFEMLRKGGVFMQSDEVGGGGG